MSQQEALWHVRHCTTSCKPIPPFGQCANSPDNDAQCDIEPPNSPTLCARCRRLGLDKCPPYVPRASRVSRSGMLPDYSCPLPFYNPSVRPLLRLLLSDWLTAILLYSTTHRHHTRHRIPQQTISSLFPCHLLPTIRPLQAIVLCRNKTCSMILFIDYHHLPRTTELRSFLTITVTLWPTHLLTWRDHKQEYGTHTTVIKLIFIYLCMKCIHHFLLNVTCPSSCLYNCMCCICNKSSYFIINWWGLLFNRSILFHSHRPTHFNWSIDRWLRSSSDVPVTRISFQSLKAFLDPGVLGNEMRLTSSSQRPPTPALGSTIGR